jgi:hypothetical protein
MKKLYLLTSMLLVFLAVNAQDKTVEFPWPDLGEPLVIEPGEPGVINETINGDTSVTGERLHQHYILKRNATYLYTFRVENVGYPLMVTAEEGEGALPIIKALGPLPGEDEAERAFHMQGDLYIKDLHIIGWDNTGVPTDNATCRLASDGLTLVAKNVVFDFNRRAPIRINALDCRVYVENSIIGPQGVAEQLWSGYTLNLRDNNTPEVIMRNNTIYDQHRGLTAIQGLRDYGKWEFYNNTVVNTGIQGAFLGRPDSLIFKDNLFVNIGIYGDGFQGDRDNFVEPYYFFTLDTNYTDTTNTDWIDPYIDFDNNHFYLDPDVAAALPDSSDKSTETLFFPYLEDLMGENNVVMEEAFTFTNFPATLNEYQAYIDDFYNFVENPAQMPQFDADILTLDFSYPTSHAAYSAASDGGPLGDLNWFGGAVNINNVRTNSFAVYPNPVEDFIKVNLDENQKVDKVVISNIVGQEVKAVENLNNNYLINIDASELRTGIYLINFYHNNTYLGTNKIIKK